MLPVPGSEISQGSTNAVNDFETTPSRAATSDSVLVLDNIIASTSRSDVPLSASYCIPRRHFNQFNGLISENYCQTGGNRRRRRSANQRMRPYRMANHNETNTLISRSLQEEQNSSSIETQAQSSYRNLNKRHDGDESIEIIEISDGNNELAIRNIQSQNNQYISERLTSTPINSSHLTVASSESIISFDASERMSSAELSLAPITESRFNLSNSNASVTSKTYGTNADENLLPSTSSRCSQNWDQTPISRDKHVHKADSSQIRGTDAIRVTRIANKLIKLSRCLKTPNFDDLSCLNCRRLPVTPVTGKCGHTRCMRCTFTHKVCPCGTKAPEIPNENTELREIIEKMMKFVKRLKLPKNQLSITAQEVKLASTLEMNMRICQRRSLSTRGVLQHISRPRIPMSPQARYKKARQLISAGLYTDAASHLARAAASTEPCARFARRLLNKTLSLIYQERGHKDASRELSSSIREQSIQSWLNPADLECVLCTNPYREPVSTPCGHTFCRCCIERSMYYRRKCALCSGPLDNFSLAETSNNVFFSAILNCMDIPPLPLEPDIIPIVISYVAFPGLPCPLFIKNFRHWLMVLRILKSGSRRFGMLSYERDHTLADYGMVLEICDCVIFEDNRCIVSTVGISRFKVIERDVRDGCDVARIRHLVDVPPTKEEVCNILMLTENIASKALNWLENMKEGVRDEIETAFGTWPIWQETQKEWWNSPDGPAWLWWIIAILPLTKEGKVHILSTQSLLTRMLAVLRTFEVMDDSLI